MYRAWILISVKGFLRIYAIFKLKALESRIPRNIREFMYMSPTVCL